VSHKISFSQILALIICFLLPTQLGQHFWPTYTLVANIRVDYLSPTLYLTYVVLVLIILVNYKQLFKLLLNFKYKVQLSLALLISFIFWVHTSPLISLILPLIFFAIIAIGTYFVAQELQKPNLRKSAVVVFILCLFLQTILSMYQWQTGHSFNRFAYWLGERDVNINQPFIPKARFINTVKLRPQGTFSHPNSLSAYAVIVSVIIFNFLTKQSHKYKFMLIPLFLSVIIITLTQSFNTYLSLLLSFLTFLTYKYLYKKIHILFFPLILGIFVPLLIAFSSYSSTHDSIMRRIVHYQIILPYVRAFPLGTGPNQFITHLPKFITPSLDLLQPLHNTYWLIILQLGIPLSALSLFIVVKTFHSKSSPVHIFLVSFILYTAIFDHYWITLVQNQLLLALSFHLVRNIGKTDKI